MKLTEQEFCFIYAVAVSFFSYGLGISNFVILRIHNCFHICYIATAYLYGIFVKCFVELAVRWKMFISFFQLCNNICTVW